jgi:hypothetical protein
MANIVEFPLLKFRDRFFPSERAAHGSDNLPDMSEPKAPVVEQLSM